MPHGENRSRWTRTELYVVFFVHWVGCKLPGFIILPFMLIFWCTTKHHFILKSLLQSWNRISFTQLLISTKVASISQVNHLVCFPWAVTMCFWCWWGAERFLSHPTASSFKQWGKDTFWHCRDSALAGRWTRWSPEVPSVPYDSVILWSLQQPNYHKKNKIRMLGHQFLLPTISLFLPAIK